MSSQDGRDPRRGRNEEWPNMTALYNSNDSIENQNNKDGSITGHSSTSQRPNQYGFFRYYNGNRDDFILEPLPSDDIYTTEPSLKYDRDDIIYAYGLRDKFRQGSTCKVLLCVFLVLGFIGVVIAGIVLSVLLSQRILPRTDTKHFESEVTLNNVSFNEALSDVNSPEFQNLSKEFCDAIREMFTSPSSPIEQSYDDCEVIGFSPGSVVVKFRLGANLFTDKTVDKNFLDKLKYHLQQMINKRGRWDPLRIDETKVRDFEQVDTRTITQQLEASSETTDRSLPTLDESIHTTVQSSIEKLTIQPSKTLISEADKLLSTSSKIKSHIQSSINDINASSILETRRQDGLQTLTQTTLHPASLSFPSETAILSEERSITALESPSLELNQAKTKSLWTEKTKESSTVYPIYDDSTSDTSDYMMSSKGKFDIPFESSELSTTYASTISLSSEDTDLVSPMSIRTGESYIHASPSTYSQDYSTILELSEKSSHFTISSSRKTDDIQINISPILPPSVEIESSLSKNEYGSGQSQKSSDYFEHSSQMDVSTVSTYDRRSTTPTLTSLQDEIQDHSFTRDIYDASSTPLLTSSLEMTLERAFIPDVPTSKLHMSGSTYLSEDMFSDEKQPITDSLRPPDYLSSQYIASLPADTLMSTKPILDTSSDSKSKEFSSVDRQIIADKYSPSVEKIDKFTVQSSVSDKPPYLSNDNYLTTGVDLIATGPTSDIYKSSLINIESSLQLDEDQMDSKPTISSNVMDLTSLSEHFSSLDPHSLLEFSKTNASQSASISREDDLGSQLQPSHLQTIDSLSMSTKFENFDELSTSQLTEDDTFDLIKPSHSLTLDYDSSATSSDSRSPSLIQPSNTTTAFSSHVLSILSDIKAIIIEHTSSVQKSKDIQSENDIFISSSSEEVNVDSQTSTPFPKPSSSITTLEQPGTIDENILLESLENLYTYQTNKPATLSSDIDLIGSFSILRDDMDTGKRSEQIPVISTSTAQNDTDTIKVSEQVPVSDITGIEEDTDTINLLEKLSVSPTSTFDQVIGTINQSDHTSVSTDVRVQFGTTILSEKIPSASPTASDVFSSTNNLGDLISATLTTSIGVDTDTTSLSDQFNISPTTALDEDTKTTELSEQLSLSKTTAIDVQHDLVTGIVISSEQMPVFDASTIDSYEQKNISPTIAIEEVGEQISVSTTTVLDTDTSTIIEQIPVSAKTSIDIDTYPSEHVPVLSSTVLIADTDTFSETIHVSSSTDMTIDSDTTRLNESILVSPMADIYATQHVSEMQSDTIISKSDDINTTPIYRISPSAKTSIDIDTDPSEHVPVLSSIVLIADTDTFSETIHVSSSTDMTNDSDTTRLNEPILVSQMADINATQHVSEMQSDTIISKSDDINTTPIDRISPSLVTSVINEWQPKDEKTFSMKPLSDSLLSNVTNEQILQPTSFIEPKQELSLSKQSLSKTLTSSHLQLSTDFPPITQISQGHEITMESSFDKSDTNDVTEFAQDMSSPLVQPSFGSDIYSVYKSDESFIYKPKELSSVQKDTMSDIQMKQNISSLYSNSLIVSESDVLSSRQEIISDILSHSTVMLESVTPEFSIVESSIVDFFNDTNEWAIKSNILKQVLSTELLTFEPLSSMDIVSQTDPNNSLVLDTPNDPYMISELPSGILDLDTSVKDHQSISPSLDVIHGSMLSSIKTELPMQTGETNIESEIHANVIDSTESSKEDKTVVYPTPTLNTVIKPYVSSSVFTEILSKDLQLSVMVSSNLPDVINTKITTEEDEQTYIPVISEPLNGIDSSVLINASPTLPLLPPETVQDIMANESVIIEPLSISQSELDTVGEKGTSGIFSENPIADHNETNIVSSSRVVIPDVSSTSSIEQINEILSTHFIQDSITDTTGVLHAALKTSTSSDNNSDLTHLYSRIKTINSPISDVEYVSVYPSDIQGKIPGHQSSSPDIFHSLSSSQWTFMETAFQNATPLTVFDNANDTHQMTVEPTQILNDYEESSDLNPGIAASKMSVDNKSSYLSNIYDILLSSSPVDSSETFHSLPSLPSSIKHSQLGSIYTNNSGTQFLDVEPTKQYDDYSTSSNLNQTDTNINSLFSLSVQNTPHEIYSSNNASISTFTEFQNSSSVFMRNDERFLFTSSTVISSSLNTFGSEAPATNNSPSVVYSSPIINVSPVLIPSSQPVQPKLSFISTKYNSGLTRIPLVKILDNPSVHNVFKTSEPNVFPSSDSSYVPSLSMPGGNNIMETASLDQIKTHLFSSSSETLLTDIEGTSSDGNNLAISNTIPLDMGSLSINVTMVDTILTLSSKDNTYSDLSTKSSDLYVTTTSSISSSTTHHPKLFFLDTT